LVLMVFTAWGRNAPVVRVAAISPSIVMRSIQSQEMKAVIKVLYSSSEFVSPNSL
jgi:hypothetical protein